jgi:hypothetical protein
LGRKQPKPPKQPPRSAPAVLPLIVLFSIRCSAGGGGSSSPSGAPARAVMITSPSSGWL